MASGGHRGHRRNRERNRKDRAQCRRHPQTNAVRVDSELRGLGGAGFDLSDCSDRHGGRRAMTLLDAVLFLPLIGFLLLLLIPKNNPGLSRMAALVISLVIFVISLGLAAAFSRSAPDGV